MGYSTFSHSHLHLVGCKANGQRRMVLINLQKAFDIINHEILLKNVYSVGFLVTQLFGFLVWVVPPFTSFQGNIKNKFSNVASTNCEVAQQSTGFSLLGQSPQLVKNFLISPLGKIPPRRFRRTTTTKYLFSTTTKG